MKEYQALRPFEVFDGRCLVALDGSEFHNSYSIHCPQCSYRLRNCGETEYYHSVLCATMVGIGHRHTVALRPEFMSPQDGDKKQDCEPKVAYRWFEKTPGATPRCGRFIWAMTSMPNSRCASGSSMPVLILSSVLKQTITKRCSIILPTLTGRTRYRSKNPRDATNRTRSTAICGPITGCPSEAAMTPCKSTMSSCGSAMSQPTNPHRRFALLLPWKFNQSNVETIVTCGRARWKIENEGFNLLKNNGYHM